MKSMTGFGFCEQQDEKSHIALDLKSYNNRYLDIITNIPSILNPLEPKLREWLSERIFRGRVEIHIRYRELEENMKVILDKNVVREYSGVLKQMMDIAGIEDELCLSHLLSMDGIIKTDKKRDLTYIWEKILPMLEQAYGDYNENRIKEGRNTQKDIISQIDVLKENLEFIRARAPEVEIKVKETLREKFRDIAGDEIEETRLLAETAMYLVKYDINEEIIRMNSHLERFLEISGDEDSAGKKLDFLCQELNREINTIGSKTPVVEVHQSVVLMKDALEKIREQLRNVE
ncbi:MAG: YicC family protein [Spirochaetaceae bacterium]|nr:YicC family protein [Spirochaetaceae bacterium]